VLLVIAAAPVIAGAIGPHRFSLVGARVRADGVTLTLLTAGLIGIVVGAVLGSRLLQGLSFGLSPLDPPTYVAAAAILLGTSLLAAWLPAQRAALVDPMRALREE
jgi:ABC-type lipoprotein release transport system permease subunit